MKKDSKDKSGAPKKEQHEPAPQKDQSVGDQLLARLLKIRVPIVPDPDPPMSPKTSPTRATQSDSSGVVERIMKAHPGLTREEVEKEIEDCGF